MTIKSCELATKPSSKRPVKIPPDVAESLKIKTAAHSLLQKSSRLSSCSEPEKETLKNTYKRAKANYQNQVRKHNVEKEVVRDHKFLDLLSKNPSQVFKTIKSHKTKDSKSIKSLKVGEKIYTEEFVADGFFDSVSSLKSLPPITSPSFDRFSEDHRHIIEICKSGRKIPRITYSKAKELLQKIRPSVTDFYSVSAAHFINGGDIAITHFQYLFNTVLENI